jgi:hypothetical protein
MNYVLLVGSSPGRGDIASSFFSGNVTSTTVNSIPTDGRTIYVQLYSEINGSWLSISYTYTASGTAPSPTPTPVPTATPTATPIPTATPTPIPVQTVDTPTFSPTGGTFRRSVKVQIFCSTAGATICYTTDGSLPTTSSPVYTAAFTLTGIGTKTVRAIGSEAGFNDSAVATAIYRVR